MGGLIVSVELVGIVAHLKVSLPPLAVVCHLDELGSLFENDLESLKKGRSKSAAQFLRNEAVQLHYQKRRRSVSPMLLIPGLRFEEISPLLLPGRSSSHTNNITKNPTQYNQSRQKAFSSFLREPLTHIKAAGPYDPLLHTSYMLLS